jgi:CheY-like chemotaxis protein
MKILIVDDEQSMGVLLGIKLRRLGHVPLLALHPRDALDMLGSDVDAVIADIDMPGMNGVELARAIRERNRDVPIAFCTGSDPSAQTTREAAAIGRVLYELCTLPEVRDLVEHLGRGCRREVAEGSGRQPALRPGARRHERRYRVHLAPIAGAALGDEPLIEDLSLGGMFVRGAHHLRLCDRVEVEVGFPGEAQRFAVAAEVAFVLTPPGAEQYDRHSGAGFAFVAADARFTAALAAYLRRLDRRCDHLILSSDELCRELAREAGYRAEPTPPPAELPQLLADRSVAAIIVPRAEAERYRAVAGDLVHGFDFFEEVELLLGDIDRAL